MHASAVPHPVEQERRLLHAAALRYVYENAIVPVVSRGDFRKLEGVISREAVLNKYRIVSRENSP